VYALCEPVGISVSCWPPASVRDGVNCPDYSVVRACNRARVDKTVFHSTDCSVVFSKPVLRMFVVLRCLLFPGAGRSFVQIQNSGSTEVSKNFWFYF